MARIPSGVLFVAFALSSPAVAEEFTKDTPAEVKKKVAAKEAVLVDVREAKEWDRGHLEGARHLPLSKLKAGVPAGELAKTLPKDKVIYCHCALGGRTVPAAEILKKAGYDVRPLGVALEDLEAAGFTKVQPAKK